ncbi:organomercurial lyase [Corynebacterium hansenii]|uniref:Organomercurial lyase n=1 Tax=Corynebacterium hansenii TaxID=394964 RepID=A0ABV7ZP54_9CORY|nr:organomercurial lyase [Corynebacterium hansenii]WJZ00518.1 Alkylmercury lyase [Corynebacterium hansenii]
MTHPTPRDLHELLAEFSAADAMTVAHGLISLRPTAHLAELANGTRVHTWCALDTLIVAHLLETDVEVRSRTPIESAGDPILNVAIRGGELVADPGFILSFPHVTDGEGHHFTEAFCPYANLFASMDAYRDWAAGQPRPTTPLTVAEADDIARAYALDVLGRGAAEASCGAAATGCAS